MLLFLETLGIVACASWADQITGNTGKEIMGRLSCPDVICSGNMLINEENVIWEGQELVQIFVNFGI